MNHYLRAIGSMLILVYSMLTAFYSLTKFLLILFIFKGCFTPKYLESLCFILKYINYLIMHHCRVCVSTKSINKMIGLNLKLKDRLKETVGINDQNLELYSETLDIYHTLVPLNQELHRLRMKTQNMTNENYNLNDVKVKNYRR